MEDCNPLQNSEGVYYAHSANADGTWHLLKDHLFATARKMDEFACNADYAMLFWETGLVHDLGKYQSEFQAYLRNGGRRGSVPHAAWGAGYARLLRQVEMAFVVDGHHKGLPDKANLQIDTEEYKNETHILNTTVKQRFLDDIEEKGPVFNPTQFKLKALDRELLIRYLFSALTDADWLDTENHFYREISSNREKRTLDCTYLIEKMNDEISKKNTMGDINKLRNTVREYAISKSKLPGGFFSLSLPTGLGKTLTSVLWALHHAKTNNLKRIIIVLPFLNIIDQTAKELKKIFGNEWVLEHHSSYNEEESNTESMEKEVNISKLATENWDYPIIATTTVQFFDSIFSNAPKRCRKNHNIAEAVVIFDEVQNLPKELISPTISMLESMNIVMKTSFLFCTATQPAFEKRLDFPSGIAGIMSLVDEPDKIYGQTRRVIYKPVNHFAPLSIKDLIPPMVQEGQSILSIYNTKKSALNAFNLAKKETTWHSLYHLSTSMCPEHRKKIVERIRTDLHDGKRVFLASTQLIEAGVDLDFPCVYREIAPLESIIQSAGRCNREGKMNENGRLGNVYIFQLEGGKFPDQLYQTLS